jgi:Tfp pilus assembly protein FimT
MERDKLRLGTEGGFTMFELIALLALFAVVSAIAVYGVESMRNPLNNAALSMEQLLRTARSRAISTTQAVEVKPLSPTLIGTSTSDSCSGTMTNSPDLKLRLPTGAGLTDTTWTICFDQRGLADSNTSFQLADHHGIARTVRVALGGGVRIDQ